MEQTRKNLKTSSIIVLALAGLTLLNILFELLFGELNNVELAADSPDNILLITKIFVLLVTLLMLLPQAYIGFKGLKIAKKPDASRGHIIWGTILLVFAALGLLSPLLALVQGNGEAFGNVSELLSMAVDVMILYEYVKYAKAVRKEIS